MCLSLNLDWQWSSASGLCACSVTISGRLMSVAKTASAARDEKKNPAFALFYFDKQANFCPGSSIFLTLQWWRKYRMNVPLLCSGSYMPPSINKNHLDLFVSLFSQSTRLSPAPSGVCLLSISCIINNIQFGLLNYENTLRERGREMTRNQPAVWVMSKSTGFRGKTICEKKATWWKEEKEKVYQVFQLPL